MEKLESRWVVVDFLSLLQEMLGQLVPTPIVALDRQPDSLTAERQSLDSFRLLGSTS